MPNEFTGPKKKFGQNFLKTPYYAERIALAIESENDNKVVEIGPGMGAVSVYLKKRFPKFHLIEVDTEVLDSLKEKLGDGDWTIHNEDILKFDFGKLGSKLHIMGNLPYNIGALIIKKTLLLAPNVLSITFMVQREVAERIVSGPDTKKNGFLSIFCQFFGKPKILFHVPPGAFFPKPNVDSSVFQLHVNHEIEEQLPRTHWEPFFAFVSAGFSTRRKTLAKSLSLKNGNKSDIQNSLIECGMDSRLRAENLDIDKWLKLYKFMKRIEK